MLQGQLGVSLRYSPLAKLSWDKWIKYEHGGLYSSDNETLTNEAWDAINYDSGSVALSDHYAIEMKLPKAQRFPWDDTKGLYFMNGQHQLHCLVCAPLSLNAVSLESASDHTTQKVLRRSFFELREHKPLSVAWPHNMHCFNALRQEVVCTADDTPRYTSPEHPSQIGVGQYRRCRDWSKLEAWSQ